MKILKKWKNCILYSFCNELAIMYRNEDDNDKLLDYIAEINYSGKVYDLTEEMEYMVVEGKWVASSTTKINGWQGE